MKKVLFVFGTRPEAIKMAPVINEFKKHEQIFDTKVCVTAQHREMLDQVLSFFEIVPDYDLDLMQPDQDLFDLTERIVSSIKPVLSSYEPDFVFVHGDTTTTFAGALAAFYSGAKVCHVEAGLRTYNMRAPFPEEMNRQLTSKLADIHFAPTEQAKNNLINEGINDACIFVTGNTVVDALHYGLMKVDTNPFQSIEALKSKISLDKDIVLVTGHRRENFGQGLHNICEALKEIALSTDLEIIYPVHLNPNVQEPVTTFLSGIKNIKLVDPLPYEAFIWLMDQAKIVITDSGGVQEEAVSLGKSILVMREITERPEAIEVGEAILVGTDKNRIVEQVKNLISARGDRAAAEQFNNVYGEGIASELICDRLRGLFV